MAIQLDVDNIKYTIVNVFGPTNQQERERVFQEVATLTRPQTMVLIGGDFNCTLDDALDRSNSTKRSHDSAALHDLLWQWKLRDVLEEEQTYIQNERDRRDFHATRHTYRYRLEEGELATSRLDRFYVDQQHVAHVRHVEVVTPVSASDHDGVLALIADAPRPPVRRKRTARRRLQYPLPFGAQHAVTALSERMLRQAEEAKAAAPAITAHAWVQWKVELRRGCLRRISEIAKQQTRSYRQRRRRLTRAMRAILPATQSGGVSVEQTVAGITHAMEGLTIDRYSRVNAIRAELMRLSRTRSRRRRRERYATYAQGTPGAEKAFFKRFHTRQGQRAAAKLPAEPGQPLSPAERLADDWKPITQRGNRDACNVHQYLSKLPAPLALPSLAALDDDFSEEEVRAAIRACPRNKAPGPDGIPNDWYRDHADTLAPLLTHLFNAWHRAGTLPTSFRKALVACIRKTTRPRSGLDYRPIALLDSDYKIYSRLLLNRLRPFLPALVSETQFGFVPGRQVHDALDVFHALQALVKEGFAPCTSIAVTLDFAKAYDTLDRPFLLAALARIGCPRGFLGAVRQMHLATTAAYMAEADISAEQQVLKGIRQGCPLAPTLFVIAVDALYQAVTANKQIKGIQLPSGAEIGPAGFADDTTMYLSNEDAMVPLFEELQRFEEASGLGVNRAKCVAIALHATHRPTKELGLPLAAVSDMNRLLGGQVSSEISTGKVWDLTVQQMRTRLRVAELKTTNVLQRIKLIQAILVPKFTFVARHHWPSSDQVNRVHQLVRNFVWHDSLADGKVDGRAWMNANVAALSPVDGGLGIPVLTFVLQELSVRVVARWAAPNQGMRSEIGKVRLRLHKTPDGSTRVSRRAPRRPTLQHSLVGTGLQLHQALETEPRERDEIELTVELLQMAGRGTTATHNWEDGWLRVNYTQRREATRPLRDLHTKRYGELHTAALLAAPALGEDILIGPDGLPLRARDYAGILTATDSIGGILEMQWHDDGLVSFKCKKKTYPLHDAPARAFRTFCDVLVYNYPSVLHNPGPTQDLQLTHPTLEQWQLAKQHG